MTTKAATPLWQFRFQADDTILMGQESAGLPEEVHKALDERTNPTWPPWCADCTAP